jgi:hypothetical protein
MNSAYNFNLYIKGKLLIKATFSGFLELPLYTGLDLTEFDLAPKELKTHKDFLRNQVSLFCWKLEHVVCTSNVGNY